MLGACLLSELFVFFPNVLPLKLNGGLLEFFCTVIPFTPQHFTKPVWGKYFLTEINFYLLGLTYSFITAHGISLRQEFNVSLLVFGPFEPVDISPGQLVLDLSRTPK